MKNKNGKKSKRKTLSVNLVKDLVRKTKVNHRTKMAKVNLKTVKVVVNHNQVKEKVKVNLVQIVKELEMKVVKTLQGNHLTVLMVRIHLKMVSH